MRYPLAERFKEPQGEGLYTGTQMAFMRVVGCSVGQQVCTACDTDFTRMQPHLGGGLYAPEELVAWARQHEDGKRPCEHICITGGEPLDRDLRPLLFAAGATQEAAALLCHIETSGTTWPQWLTPRKQPRNPGEHAIQSEGGHWSWRKLWVTISPKPGYIEDMVLAVADELKVIVGGLGDGPGWPTIDDALRWADLGRLVYIQPRNYTREVNDANLASAIELVHQYPQLRLSCQLHKFLGVR